LSGDEVVIEALMNLKTSAGEMAEALESGDKSNMAGVMRRTCKATFGLHPGISKPYQDVIEPLYQSRDILSWKPVGAGAGGCVMMLVRDGCETIVRDVCEQANWSRLSWDYDDEGVCVEAV